MPDLDARFDRLEHAIHGLTSVTAELVRENRTLVQGLAGDRAVLRDTLRELSGFVATAGIALERLERQVGRLAEAMETGFARLELAIGENNRLIVENNQLIANNTDVIRRLLDILARGRGNGEGAPD